MDQNQIPGNGKNLATASLVLGIVSIVFYFFSAAFIFSLLGIVAGVVGCILSSRAKKEGVVGGMVTAGLVLSIIGIVLNGIGFIVCTICAGAILSAANGLM